MLFIAAGIMHFASPTGYVAIVPDYLPAPLLLVHLSGAAEILGGIAILIPRLRKFAGWGLILLLLAVFPANIDAYQHGMIINGKPVPEWLLLLRLPLQAVFIFWVYTTCCRSSSTHSTA
ncbi:DoxX family protein [Oceaniferula spumae]